MTEFTEYVEKPKTVVAVYWDGTYEGIKGDVLSFLEEYNLTFKFSATYVPESYQPRLIERASIMDWKSLDLVGPTWICFDVEFNKLEVYTPEQFRNKYSRQ